MSDIQEYTCHFCGNKITDEECHGKILQSYTVIGLISYCSKCREIGELIIKEYNKQSRKMDLMHEYYDKSELFDRIERIHKYKTGTIQVTDQLKEILNELPKEQLIYLIEQFYHSQFLISEVCVEESKQHISSKRAIKKIHNCLYDMPITYNVDNFKAQIDLKMNKITVEEYRKTLGLEGE